MICYASLTGTRRNLAAAMIKSLRSERDQFKTELDKIHGARRKLSQTTGTSPAPAKKDTGLSIRDLDIRKAFDNFDWDNNAR